MDQAPQSNPVPLRYSILELVKEYDDKKPARLDALVRAWKKVQELDPSDPKSFFYLAGFHGFPFRGMGATDAAWWGGYCHHADVLFPTWHRAYCKKVEESLQFFDPTVTLPYWDETDSLSQSKGAPWIFTSRTYKFGEPKQGEEKEIKNPLHSFVLPLALSTQRKEMTEIVYTKPKGYETVRYPYAGLVSDENFQKETDAYNAQFKDMSESQITDLFNENVVSWINVGLTGKGELGAFERCLQAPNYTVFSNTRSSGIWNDSTKENVMPLESPHNHIHLCVGGFKIDSDRSQDYNVATSGDMGENETASFDPIFFFHHCNIDRVFWIWQKLHNQTDQIDIIDDYPGTIGDDQPPAGIALNEYYSLTTPLHPFKRVNENGKEVPFTSQDLINIEKQLGYGYSKGSLDEVKLKEPVERKTPVKKLILEDLNKTDISGSFIVHAFLQNKTKKDDKINLGGEVVLNRWEPKQCKNCKITSQVKLAFEIPDSVKNLEDYEPSFVFGSRKGAVEKEKSLLKAGGDEQYSGRPLKFSTKFVGNN